MPNRTGEGAPPLLGRIHTDNCKFTQPDDGRDGGDARGGEEASWWLFTGLGVRGLLYHGVMAKQLAAAVLESDEGLLDDTVRRWQ